MEGSTAVESTKGMRLPNMFVECDYEFLGMTAAGANKAVHWDVDPEYLTQVSYRRLTPCLLQVRPPIGPDVAIAVEETFESFRTYELIYDSTDRERQGLAVRRMYRTISPWVTENPLMLHVRHADPKTVRSAIDQCAEVGFEMVILTFGSGFNIENEDPEYIAQIKELVEYAHSKGIELGGYSLLASRRISDEHDVINPETGNREGLPPSGILLVSAVSGGRTTSVSCMHFSTRPALTCSNTMVPIPGMCVLRSSIPVIKACRIPSTSSGRPSRISTNGAAGKVCISMSRIFIT